MSNLSSRVKYDANNLSMFDKSNKDVNVIVLDPTVKENNSACYSPAGGINSKSQVSRPMNGSQLNLGDLADVENRLMNRGYELNNDQGRTNTDYSINYGKTPVTCEGSDKVMNENSRYTNPVVDYREMYTAPYNFTPYLFVSPQQVTADNDNIMSPNRYGESSRYSAKNAKYDLKPKQFSSVNTPVNYNELVKGLLPKVNTLQSAKPYI